MTRRAFLLLPLVVAGCATENPTGAPLAYGTAYVVEAPLAFESGGVSYLAESGSSVVGPGFAEHLAQLTSALNLAQSKLSLLTTERDQLATQLDALRTIVLALAEDREELRKEREALRREVERYEMDREFRADSHDTPELDV